MHHFLPLYVLVRNVDIDGGTEVTFAYQASVDPTWKMAPQSFHVPGAFWQYADSLTVAPRSMQVTRFRCQRICSIRGA